MTPKILIEVKGGTVINISATEEVKIVIVDYDNSDNGSNPIMPSDPLYPDAIFKDGEAHTLFTDASDPEEMEIKDELKRLKF